MRSTLFFVFLICAAVGGCTADVSDRNDTGLDPETDIDSNALYGGKLAKGKEFRSVVLMVYNANGNQYPCTGVKVGRRTFMTAAHCVRYKTPSGRFGGLQEGDYLGITNKVRAPKDVPGARVTSVIVHSTFKEECSFYDCFKDGVDIAIVKVDRDDGIPEAFVDLRPVRKDDPVRIMGYGAPNMFELHYGNVRISPYNDDFLRVGNGRIRQGGGDSGAPVFRGYRAVVGIVSGGEGAFHFYSRVDDLESWFKFAGVNLKRSLPPFADDDFTAHEGSIHTLSKMNITDGCDTGKFCPAEKVTRCQMAAFLGRALGIKPQGSSRFIDDNGMYCEGYINVLNIRNVIDGCSSNRYCPNESLSRAQMAALLNRAFDFPRPRKDYFWDDNGTWYQGAANRLAEAGVSKGCGGGKFCGSDKLTRGQMASFLVRAVRY